MENKKLIENVASALDKDRDEIIQLAQDLCSVVSDALKDGGSIAIPTFGTFDTKLRSERIAVHPSTGKKLLVPPKITVNFKPSALLKQKIQ